MKGLASNLFEYAAVVLLTSLPLVAFSSTVIAQENPPAASLIVKMVKGLPAEEQLAVIQRDGGIPKSSIPQLRIYVVEVPEADVEAVMEKYRNDPAVASVELNQTRKVEGVPNDRPAQRPVGPPEDRLGPRCTGTSYPSAGTWRRSPSSTRVSMPLIPTSPAWSCRACRFRSQFQWD